MNTLTILPEFDISNHTHILPSLERAQISTADLLTLDALDVAKRAQVPPAEVKKLADALIHALHADTTPAISLSRDDEGGKCGPPFGLSIIKRCGMVSTLDDDLDNALGGGIARGHVTEIVGER